MDKNKLISELLDLHCSGCDGVRCGCTACAMEKEIEEVVEKYIKLNEQQRNAIKLSIEKLEGSEFIKKEFIRLHADLNLGDYPQQVENCRKELKEVKESIKLLKDMLK